MAEYQTKINTSELQELALQDLIRRFPNMTISEYLEGVLIGNLNSLIQEFRVEDVKNVSEALRGASDAEIAQVKQILRVNQT